MTSVNGFIICAPAAPPKQEQVKGLVGLKNKNGLTPLKLLVRCIGTKAQFEAGQTVLVKSDTYNTEIAPTRQSNEMLKGPTVVHPDNTVTGGEPLDFVLVHETHVIAVA